MPTMRLLCAVALLATCSASADASTILSSQDWKSAGDGLLTLDSNTGSLWLDLSATKGRSYADVVANLAPGGEFSGFRVASSFEVLQLFGDADLPSSFGTAPATPALVSAYHVFSALVTRTFVLPPNPNFASYTYSSGFVTDSPSGVTSLGGVDSVFLQHLDWLSANPDTIGVYYDYPLPETSAYSTIGTWLVNEKEVVTTPEPTSMALAGFAGVGLAIGAWRRRRQQKQAA